MSRNWTDPAGFKATIVNNVTNDDQVRAAANDYKVMVLCVLEEILRRYERTPDYPFIDTKLSLLTGQDFPDSDPLRGKSAIFGWVQGRGLEALAGHNAWIQRQTDIDAATRQSFDRRIRKALAEVSAATEKFRARNNGHLCFMMDRTGRPMQVDARGHVVPLDVPPAAGSWTSDMFYCKGLAAAAAMLGDKALLQAARDLFEKITADVASDNFRSDQLQLDPRNPVGHVPGRHGHGTRMMAIGACACFTECTGDARYAARGLDYIDHILRHHVNLSPKPALGQQYDMWEFNNEAGQPMVEEGQLRNDPGHATEFVGLALKLIAVCETAGVIDPLQQEKVRLLKTVLPEVLRKNFLNGISPRGYGICKAFDLIGRRTINDQLPWWNLPETIRAALEVLRVSRPEEWRPFAEIAASCSNAFVRYYVRPGLHLMAYQTLGADGKPVDVIPGTPDADAAYHTGLSIIDALDCMKQRLGAS